jgi:hypothetical protein
MFMLSSTALAETRFFYQQSVLPLKLRMDIPMLTIWSASSTGLF